MFQQSNQFHTCSRLSVAMASFTYLLVLCCLLGNLRFACAFP